MEDIINKIQPFHFLITHYPILGSNNIKVASYREGKKKEKVQTLFPNPGVLPWIRRL